MSAFIPDCVEEPDGTGIPPRSAPGFAPVLPGIEPPVPRGMGRMPVFFRVTFSWGTRCVEYRMARLIPMSLEGSRLGSFNFLDSFRATTIFFLVSGFGGFKRAGSDS